MWCCVSFINTCCLFALVSNNFVGTMETSATVWKHLSCLTSDTTKMRQVLEIWRHLNRADNSLLWEQVKLMNGIKQRKQNGQETIKRCKETHHRLTKQRSNITCSLHWGKPENCPCFNSTYNHDIITAGYLQIKWMSCHPEIGQMTVFKICYIRVLLRTSLVFYVKEIETGDLWNIVL